MSTAARPRRAQVAPQALSDLSTVITFLGSLPDDSEAIATHLRARFVRGVPGDPCKCPLRQWIDPFLAGYLDVDRGHVIVHGDGYELRVDVPTAVIEFTLDFDSGAYPFLYEAGVE